MITLKKYGQTWCGPCKQFDKVLQQIEQEYKDDVKIEKLDISTVKDEELQSRPKSVPFTVVIVDGEEKEVVVGAKSFETVVELINKYLIK